VGIEAELPKFHLPGGVKQEILFLTRQTTAKTTQQP